MPEKTYIQTEAFDVEDEHGNRSVVICTRPVVESEDGKTRTVELGVEFRLRNGKSVIPLSDSEFAAARGKRWRKIR